MTELRVSIDDYGQNITFAREDGKKRNGQFLVLDRDEIPNVISILENEMGLND